MGAPRKANKKDRVLRVRLEAKQQTEFEKLMAKRGESQSGFVRRLIVQAIAEEHAQAPLLAA